MNGEDRQYLMEVREHVARIDERTEFIKADVAALKSDVKKISALFGSITGAAFFFLAWIRSAFS